jgi:circadian clock protein KaiC
MTDAGQQDTGTLLRTGIEGLDDVLGGGLAPHRVYLVEGHPGAGKTTLALQFLREGVRLGETCMFVSLSESEQELQVSAEAHGWTLEGIKILELIASEDSLKPDARYTMYHPSEVELVQTAQAVLDEAARVRPARIVFDSLSELRLMAENPLRYRRQILALKQYFTRHHATVLLIDDCITIDRDLQLHSLAHGVISLERHNAPYGVLRRQLQVVKMRGRPFREGFHDMVIRHGGVQVFPRLVAAEYRGNGYQRQAVGSGLPALDALLGGGLASGTSTLVMGAAGTGKSSLATHYAVAAAQRGERSCVFLFDESVGTFLERSAGLGMPLQPLVDGGRLTLHPIDPAELSPGEFADLVRQTVEQGCSGLLVIDSLNGYLNAMPNERYLTLHLNELLAYLQRHAVTTLLLMTQHGLVGEQTGLPVDASYLADTVVLLRYFETMGAVRQAISVIKKRTGPHERTIRELSFGPNGLAVGEPLSQFQGVLSGAPQLLGQDAGALHLGADNRSTRSG